MCVLPFCPFGYRSVVIQINLAAQTTLPSSGLIYYPSGVTGHKSTVSVRDTSCKSLRPSRLFSTIIISEDWVNLNLTPCITIFRTRRFPESHSRTEQSDCHSAISTLLYSGQEMCCSIHQPPCLESLYHLSEAHWSTFMIRELNMS